MTARAIAVRARLPEPASMRGRILAAAIRLFQERGYHGAGLAEILAESQAPKGSLYHHFPGGKPELAVAAVAWIAGEYEASIVRRRARGTSAADIIRALARAQARWLKETEWRQGSLFTSLAQGFVPEAPVVHDSLARFAARRRALFERMLHEDNVRDAAATAALALATLDGGLLEARVLHDAAPLIETAERVASIVESQIA